MSERREPFDRSELQDDSIDPVPHGGDEAAWLAMARELETIAGERPPLPGSAFTATVMDAISREANPAPAHEARVALSRADARGFVRALRDAGRVAFGLGRPMFVRAQALALVLAVALVAATIGSVGAVGAANLLAAPAFPALARSPEPAAPSPTLEPESSAEAGGTQTHEPDPSETRPESGGDPGSSRTPDLSPSPSSTHDQHPAESSDPSDALPSGSSGSSGSSGGHGH
jgi:hypothetical protein